MLRARKCNPKRYIGTISTHDVNYEFFQSYYVGNSDDYYYLVPYYSKDTFTQTKTYNRVAVYYRRGDPEEIVSHEIASK